jgi:hypothetical protein
VLQLTPAALERHLQGMTEKLRSGVNGKVREAIQQSVARIPVGDNGSLTIEGNRVGCSGWTALFLRWRLCLDTALSASTANRHPAAGATGH